MLKDLARDVDRLLRGKFTKTEDLRAGRIEVPVKTLVIVGVLLGTVYGLFMGLYALLRPGSPSFVQLLYTTIKVPLLYLLTLGVTFPSLYVFSALANSRLRSFDTLRLLLVAVGVNLALLASFGPVTGFFTLSTDSYPFMILLNVVFFGVSGIVGLTFLSNALKSVFSAEPPPIAEAPTEPDPGDEDEEEEEETVDAGVKAPESGVNFIPVRDRYSPHPAPSPEDVQRRIFVVWTIIYGIVGAQMGWILRPFIGSPNLPVQFLRERDSNFFQAILRTLGDLFS